MSLQNNTGGQATTSDGQGKVEGMFICSVVII